MDDDLSIQVIALLTVNGDGTFTASIYNDNLETEEYLKSEDWLTEMSKITKMRIKLNHTDGRFSLSSPIVFTGEEK